MNGTPNVYTERLQQLLSLEYFGMKLGLENIRALLAQRGDPQDAYPTIHIAGTNGKGSVAATFAAIYQTAGRKTGLYTSPHLVDFRERIKIDGEMIDEEYISGFIEQVWPIVEERNMTFFEVTTALALQYFADQRVDIAIIETGLGGRLDATNVLRKPLATVVTSIAMDHMAQLGNSLEAIASEKAGIFKPRVPAVVNCPSELRFVFEGRAHNVGCPLCFVADEALPPEYASILPSLPGPHQLENLRTTLATLSVLDAALPINAVTEGIANTASRVGLHARLESVHSDDLLARGVTLILDAGHNPAALARIAEYLLDARVRPTVVLGLMSDKDIPGVLAQVARFAGSLVAVSANSPRALPAEALAEEARKLGIETELGGSAVAGVAFAARSATRGETVLLTGSHYIIGEFLQNFRKTHRVIV